MDTRLPGTGDPVATEGSLDQRSSTPALRAACASTFASSVYHTGGAHKRSPFFILAINLSARRVTGPEDQRGGRVPLKSWRETQPSSALQSGLLLVAAV